MSKPHKLPLGLANSKFAHEQSSMVARLAQSEGGNNSSIGQQGEVLVLAFLDKYLPPQFIARKGHYRKIDGSLSREIDVMILDSRFPVLNETEAGVVHGVQHALVAAIEVKRTLGQAELSSIRNDALALAADISQTPVLADKPVKWSKPACLALAFRSSLRLDTLAVHYFTSPPTWCDVYVLEHGFDCRNVSPNVGAFLHTEGDGDGAFGTSARTENPLSDFYYMLLECCYTVVAERNILDASLRGIVASYYNWSNVADSFKAHKILPLRTK
jgi:hypothetical protein